MKKIFKTIGLICMAVVVAVGSIFVTKKQTQNEINVASAGSSSLSSFDTLYSIGLFSTYSGGSVVLGVNSYSVFPNKLFRYKISLTQNSTDKFSFNPIFQYLDVDNSVFTRLYYSVNSYIDDTFISLGTKNDVVDLCFDTIYCFNFNNKFESVSSSGSPYPLLGSSLLSYVYCESGFNFNVSYLNCYSLNTLVDTFYGSLPNVFTSNLKSYSDTSPYLICYDYVDSNGLKFSIAFLSDSVADSFTYFYLPNSDLSDNSYYSKGYSDGLADNQQNIYNQGYLAGRTIGYGEGHSAGVNDSNTYTFTGLIGAVIDVPVKTILGLLNFEILGINIFGFAVGLISFSVLLFIIRKIKGGR